MSLRPFFFQKIFGYKKVFFFFTISNVGFISNDLSKGEVGIEEMCAEQTVFFIHVYM